ECYREAENVVWHQVVRSPNTGVIFTGQPGIGKTLFLWYLLIRLLQDNQNILFIDDGGRAILFYLGNIYVLLGPLDGDDLPENFKDGFIWLLFDTPSPSSPIPLVANSPLCFPIQTPSPNPAHFSTWRKHRRPLYTAFPIWSIEELRRGLELDREFEGFKARLEQYLKSWHDTPSAHPTNSDPIHFHFTHIRSLHGENPPEIEKAIDDILNNAVKYFGFVARDIFRAVLSDFHDIYNDTMSALKKSPNDLGEMLRMVVGSEDLSMSQPSHLLIVIKSRHKVGLSVEWDVDFRTSWVARAVARKFQKYEERRVRELISYLKFVSQGVTLASWLFEAYAHRKIVAGVRQHNVWQRNHARKRD
ncbi:hypothetical protein F5148DRAFT_957840, partial [Russula earlei]